VFSSFIFFGFFFVGDCNITLISGVALLLKMTLSYVNNTSDLSDVRVLTLVFLMFPCKVRQLVRSLCETWSQYKHFQALPYDHSSADCSCTASCKLVMLQAGVPLCKHTYLFMRLFHICWGRSVERHLAQWW